MTYLRIARAKAYQTSLYAIASLFCCLLLSCDGSEGQNNGGPLCGYYECTDTSGSNLQYTDINSMEVIELSLCSILREGENIRITYQDGQRSFLVSLTEDDAIDSVSDLPKCPEDIFPNISCGLGSTTCENSSFDVDTQTLTFTNTEFQHFNGDQPTNHAVFSISGTIVLP